MSSETTPHSKTIRNSRIQFWIPVFNPQRRQDPSTTSNRKCRLPSVVGRRGLQPPPGDLCRPLGRSSQWTRFSDVRRRYMLRKENDIEPTPNPRLNWYLTVGDRCRDCYYPVATTGTYDNFGTIPACMRTRGRMQTRKGFPLGDF